MPRATTNQGSTRPSRSSQFRQIGPKQTVPEVLSDEMNLRAHSQADAARAMDTSEANVSRWSDASNPSVPDVTEVRSLANVNRLVRYLRLSLDDYALLSFNTKMAAARRKLAR